MGWRVGTHSAWQETILAEPMIIWLGPWTRVLRAAEHLRAAVVQCKDEITQQETILAAATRAAAAEALEELHCICRSTRLAVPPLPAGTADLIATEGPDTGGQVHSNLVPKPYHVIPRTRIL